MVVCSFVLHQVENKSRHIHDFLVTGPEANPMRFLALAKDNLNMQDAVRLYKTGDAGRFQSMNLRKLENGCALQDKPFVIHDIATALEMNKKKNNHDRRDISTQR